MFGYLRGKKGKKKRNENHYLLSMFLSILSRINNNIKNKEKLVIKQIQNFKVLTFNVQKNISCNKNMNTSNNTNKTGFVYIFFI